MWLVLVSVDPAREEEGSWTDRLPSLEGVAAISRLLLPIPLALASLGTSRMSGRSRTFPPAARRHHPG
jgi:hypothetical protein